MPSMSLDTPLRKFEHTMWSWTSEFIVMIHETAIYVHLSYYTYHNTRAGPEARREGRPPQASFLIILERHEKKICY